MPQSPLHRLVLDWYGARARDLPWRRHDADAWAVLVSEVMLQQTPVARALPVYEAWLRRWPTPGALARDSLGEAVRMWGQLGYPRRARRLWLAAGIIDERSDSMVPSTHEELVSLPGVGEYTATAVRAFAFRHRTVVLDTNVRRVLARIFRGEELPPKALTVDERREAEQSLPDDPDTAATWSVAVMELGALVCTSLRPRCADCPVSHLCAWRALGYPAHAGRPRRGQPYDGTDRQCRGRILALLRHSEGPVPREAVTLVWDESIQRERALASLIDDGLAVEIGEDAMGLP